LTWRQQFRPVIREVLEETREHTYQARRKALWRAYAADEDAQTSYTRRIWLDEVRVQLGHKKKRKGLKEREGAQRRLL
jgi:hypothetical protein